MATLREAVVTRMTSDGTLTALLTGSIFNAEDFSFDGGGADEIPRAANGVDVLPFAIVRFKASNHYGPLLVQGELQSVEIYVYDNVGYVTIDAAISRIKALFHFTEVSANDRQLAFFLTTHISGEMDAPEFGGIPCQFIRFSNTQVRV